MSNGNNNPAPPGGLTDLDLPSHSTAFMTGATHGIVAGLGVKVISILANKTTGFSQAAFDNAADLVQLAHRLAAYLA